MKAVLLIRATSVEVTSDSRFMIRVNDTLQRFARENGFEITKRYQAIEDGQVAQSTLFLEALNYIESLDEKTALLTYHSQERNPGGPVGAKLSELQRVKKIEFKTYCHPCFSPPSKGETKLWRYLDLPKFLDLIQRRRLFFSRVDRFRDSDRQEGVIHTQFHKKLLQQLEAGETKLPENFGITRDQLLEMERHAEAFNESSFLKRVFLNCWHMSEHESFAMWKVYSQSFGICVQSTYLDLLECFVDDKWSCYNDKSRIYIGKVIYIDKQSSLVPQENLFWPYIHKSQEFQYEQELRCLLNVWDGENESFAPRVDTHRLIKAIHLSPFAPAWFKSVVEGLCEKYDFPVARIRQSDLS